MQQSSNFCSKYILLLRSVFYLKIMEVMDIILASFP